MLALVEPRDKFAYSNLHFTLAGRIIEAVTGKSWKDFLAERVFATLEMRDATCYASQLYANPLAAWPIVERNGAWNRSPLVKNDAVMHAAGGMGASAADMAHWLRFQLSGKTPDGGDSSPPICFAEMHTRQAVYDEPDSGPLGLVEDGYTLGWFTGHLGERRILRHGGGYVGTSTMVVLFPEDKVGMAVLMNESAPNAGFTMLVASDIASKLLDLAGCRSAARVASVRRTRARTNGRAAGACLGRAGRRPWPLAAGRALRWQL